ncbi:MAG: hypothetical protein U1E73_08865 [Planctomycetota bacterium]
MKDSPCSPRLQAQHAVDVDTEIVVAATIHPPAESPIRVMKEAIVETNGVMFSAGAKQSSSTR